ncbi:MAG: Gfo/Idh/MocA family oxidoreductase [Acidimicrobiaceae bacterium]|nr:Gfo/Idh/MocA family oxidoreductase [Acidimicrobiaceae bacterium]
MRLLQVGMGGWGRKWAVEVFPQVGNVELVGHVDRLPAALALTIEQGIAAEDDCYPSLEAALESTEPEAVLVTADLSSHVPLASAALNAGKHVLVEKPFAPTLVEARELVALGESRGLTLMVSQNYRFFPAVRAVQAIVEKGDLGALHTVNIDFRRSSELGPDGRTPHHFLVEPLLVDMSVHHFDLLRAVLGLEAREVFCRTWTTPWSLFDDPAEGAAIITFEDGLTVSYRGSWLSTGPTTPWAAEWRMEFERGQLWWTSRDDLIDGVHGEHVLLRPAGQAEQVVELPRIGLADRAGSLTEFAAAISAGRVPESSGRENLGTIALVEAAVASAGSRSPRLLEVV